MTPRFPYPFNSPFQGEVDAAGDLVIEFGPENSVTWTVEQVSLEMPTAPVGATAEVRYMNALVDATLNARRSAAGGVPSIFLQGGERMSVVWANCTPGDPGRVLVTYRKQAYGET
jgi:hypothetical protein